MDMCNHLVAHRINPDEVALLRADDPYTACTGTDTPLRISWTRINDRLPNSSLRIRSNQLVLLTAWDPDAAKGCNQPRTGFSHIDLSARPVRRRLQMHNTIQP